MIRAVIFDMGGTLLRYRREGMRTWRDMEDAGIRGIYRYLLDQGHPLPPHEDEYVEAMFQRLAEGWQQATGGQISLRAVDWIAAGAAAHRLRLDEAALLEAARHYARPLRDGLTAMPGAAETLTWLRAVGYRTALISNTMWPAELHLEDLDKHGLLAHLEHTIFSGDAGIWKPDARIFHHACAALGVAPAEAVFVGDNPREDIAGAQGAGLRAVWHRGDEFPLPTDLRPDATIDNLPELPALLARWNAT